MALPQGPRIGKPCWAIESGSSVGLMTHLTSVELWQDTEVHVRFSTSLDLTEASDTAVLQLVHGGGSELGIRIERGRVTDVYELENSSVNPSASDSPRGGCCCPAARCSAPFPPPSCPRATSGTS